MKFIIFKLSNDFGPSYYYHVISINNVQLSGKVQNDNCHFIRDYTSVCNVWLPTNETAVGQLSPRFEEKFQQCLVDNSNDRRFSSYPGITVLTY